MIRDVLFTGPVKKVPGSMPEKCPAVAGKSRTDFETVLREETEKSVLKFSAHAVKRLKERNISLALEDLARIDGAVRKAAARGARDLLIIYSDLALVASIKNKTVVTALDGKSAEDHIFTNIDSAVIVR